MASRDPITTHVLNQTTGTPAASITATLTLESPLQASSTGPSNAPPPIWTASTAEGSGRIEKWHPATAVASEGDSGSLGAYLATYANSEFASTPMVWSLQFDTKKYWEGMGVKSFYPSVVVKFEVEPGDERKHWHVPVLLGPWGYTTYRGT